MPYSKDEYNSYCKERYRKRRECALVLLGSECKHCGVVEGLVFDHIDPATKNFAIAKRLHGLSWAKIEKELELCQLLCVPCHKKKTFSEKIVVEHGRRAMWERCKCNICRNAKNTYKRAWKEKRKLQGYKTT